jgi:transposase
MMDTMDTEKKRTRRNYSPALKAQVLTECIAPGASVAKVAMAHGIKAKFEPAVAWRQCRQSLRCGPKSHSAATPYFTSPA